MSFSTYTNSWDIVAKTHNWRQEKRIDPDCGNMIHSSRALYEGARES